MNERLSIRLLWTSDTHNGAIDVVKTTVHMVMHHQSGSGSGADDGLGNGQGRILRPEYD